MPSEIQISRYESLIQTILNDTIRLELDNPIAKHAEITYVNLSNDLSLVKVYISCLDRSKIEKVLEELKRAKGFLRTKLAKSLKTYKCPEINFYIDETVDRVEKIEQLFKEINKKG